MDKIACGFDKILLKHLLFFFNLCFKQGVSQVYLK